MMKMMKMLGKSGMTERMTAVAQVGQMAESVMIALL